MSEATHTSTKPRRERARDPPPRSGRSVCAIGDYSNGSHVLAEQASYPSTKVADRYPKRDSIFARRAT